MPRRFLTAFVSCLALAAAACSGEPGRGVDVGGPAPTAATSTTQRPAPVEPPALTTTSVAPPITIQPEVPPPTPPLLVAARDGLFLEDDRGVTKLVDGLVSYAVEDSRGGVLFQVDRGRTWPGEEPPLDSTVWWVPAGSERALDLLVTVDPLQLTLHDAAVAGNDVTILYTRSEGWSLPDAIDRLRRFSLDEREVTEVLTHGAWEAGYRDVRSAAGLISMTEFGQVESWCRVVDMDADPVVVGGVPEPTVCEEPDCPWACSLSRSGSRYGHVRTLHSGGIEAGYDVVVRSTRDGAELFRFRIAPGQGYPIDLDVSDTAVVVNRAGPNREPMKALVLIPSTTGIIVLEAATAGAARLASSVIDIPYPVANPVERSIVLRTDGLGGVGFGDAVGPALHVLTGLLGDPDVDDLLTGPWSSPGPGSCFEATSYGCVDYYRWASWEHAGLGVVFTDGGLFREDGVPHLTGWVAMAPTAGVGPLTEAGIGAGATVADLRAAYGAELYLSDEPDECVGTWYFTVFSPEITIETRHIRGTLSGPPDGSGEVVVDWMEAGQGSSC